MEEMSTAPYRIVFIHLGTELPSYAATALMQARLFNPNAAILLIASQAALDATPIAEKDWMILPVESLQKTSDHLEFCRLSRLDKSFRNGFWYYTTERLFCLDDFITQYNLNDTFHLENDNLLYCNLEELLPVFHEYYEGMAIPFEQDFRGGAGIVFVTNHTSINALARHLKNNISRNKSEMELLGTFKTSLGQKYICPLPVINSEYVRDHLPLTDLMGRRDLFDPNDYSYCIEQFQSIFDMCSYGQYIGGIDPRNGSDGPGYINPSAIFNCSQLDLTWELDSEGRNVPYMAYHGKKYRINNLHIHCKNLQKYSSLETR